MKVAIAFAALVAATGLSAASEPAPIDGNWVTAEKNGVVTIAACGAARCGRLAKFLVAAPGGADQRDINNPDPAMRSRKLIGMPLITGLKPAGTIWKGSIYDPKRGKTYRSELKRRDATTLEVKGCIGPFCQTQVWKRAS